MNGRAGRGGGGRGGAGAQAVFNWVHTTRGLLARLPDHIEHDFSVLGMSRNLPPGLQRDGPHDPGRQHSAGPG